MKPAARPAGDVTTEILSRARAIRFEYLPADVVFLAKQCLLDWLALAEAMEPDGGLHGKSFLAAFTAGFGFAPSMPPSARSGSVTWLSSARQYT